MQLYEILDMKKRPPHKLDVMANAVFGDHIPELFRAGKYYKEDDIVFTYGTKDGDINVWKCNKTGTYSRPVEPGWENWSLEDIRNRLKRLDDFIDDTYDIYETHSYEQSYYLDDVGIRDWENRGSYFELFINSLYYPKNKYQVVDEQIIPLKGANLPDEDLAVIYLSKSNNKLTNLIRRIERHGNLADGVVKIPFPVDESLIVSYIYDLYVDGVYVSDKYIETVEKDDGKYIDISFGYKDNDPRWERKIENDELVYVPPVDITEDSDFVFIFYISISHDLSLKKTDCCKFIGEEGESKWLDMSMLDFTENYQEITVYNNGIRLREDEYVLGEDRISIDNPNTRFIVGSYAVVSMKSFVAKEHKAVANVKQETVPIFNGNTGLIPIPFLNYDNQYDRFLLFNDAGTLLGNQRWFEDNGYVNFYDHNDRMADNHDMIDFRMISRDKNMVMSVYTLTTIFDNQKTYELPDRLRYHYFHMIFTENGEFISRSKYALSGKLLQFRDKYATHKVGERLEVICFDYLSEYGFTSMTNYKAPWKKDYVEIELDDLPHDENIEIEPEPEPEPTSPDDAPPVLDYTPIVNPDNTTLKYKPKAAPGTQCIFVQDVILDKEVSPLISEIPNSEMSMLLGVDSDNQVILSTTNGALVKFNRDHIEDTRYTLYDIADNAPEMIETDDMGYIYFKPHGKQEIYKVHRKGGKNNWCWEFSGRLDETFRIAKINSFKYYNGYLYLEYSPNGATEYTIGKIDAATGKLVKSYDTTIPKSQDLDSGPSKLGQRFCAKISKYTGHIFVGAVGHTVHEFDENGTWLRHYSDGVVSYPYYVSDIYVDKDNNVYAIATYDNEHVLVKYNAPKSNIDPAEVAFNNKYFPSELFMAFDADDHCYIYDQLENKISKLDKTDGGNVIWSYNNFETAITKVYTFFVDPIDYHVYIYYISNNNMYLKHYTELEQNELPLPKYRHVKVLNGEQNVTTTDLVGSSMKEINWLSSPTNRLYIGTLDGSIYTFTQSFREMSKKRTTCLWKTGSVEEKLLIIPDYEYNFYIIKDYTIEKWNRYERILWHYDGYGIIKSVSEHIVFNKQTKDLVFIYTDDTGLKALGKITEKGTFEQLDITLPNGIKPEEANCAIGTDKNGNYYFGYTGKTIYIYNRLFGFVATCGTDTKELLDGPVGNIVADKGYVYVSVKDDYDEKFSKLIQYYSGYDSVSSSTVFTKKWEHDFMNSGSRCFLFMDSNHDIYMSDNVELRKVDIYGNYIWRCKFNAEVIEGGEPTHIVMDEFFRLYFLDVDRNLHRIDQYDLTLDPIPDEVVEPPEPSEPDDPDITETPENYIKVQRKFDIPFEFTPDDSALLLFTNTGQYIGNRFYEIRKDNTIRLKGSPIYENGWVDIVLIKNEKESIVTDTGGNP